MKFLGAFLVSAVLLASHVGAAEIAINFGSNSGVTNWNEVNNPNTDLADLVYLSDGSSTGISLETDAGLLFNGVNNTGTTTPGGAAAAAGFVNGVTNSSFFGNTSSFAGGVFPEAVLTFSGLNSNATYTFTFFASRTGVSDNREANYSLVGAASEALELDAAVNTDNVAVSSAFVADGAGEIILTVTPGDDNTNGFGFFYLGGVIIDEVVPEPSSFALLGLSGGLLLMRRRKK